MLIVQVKRKKYKISYNHFRDYGETICYITDMNGKDLAEGSALCSEQDHFCRAIGRKVALTRAINALFAEKKERAAFWAAVWKARADITDKRWTV